MNKFSILFILLNLPNILTGSIELTESNFDSVIDANQLVFVNFYVNWCRFSQNLNPIYEDLAEKMTKQYSKKKNEGLIQIGKVNCEISVSLCKKYQINKYPTLKLFRNGLVNKREYRKSRDLNSLIEYLQSEIESPIVKLNNSNDMTNVDVKYDYLIGHFVDSNSKSFEIFSKIANLLRDQCHFAVSFDNSSKEFVYYRSNELLNRKEFYSNSLENEQMFYLWSNNKCSKLIRQIRFDNAEELTEEGLPFLILFHRIDDQKSIELFEQQIQKQLIHFQSKINFLHGDGAKFVHPLKHLGKTVDDLPVILIDTFQHMFIFEDFHQISNQGKLLKFVEDLFSGKLHDEFHNRNGNEKLNLSFVESVFVRLSPNKFNENLRMSIENFVNWTVSIDCGSTLGQYQGQIIRVDPLNQTLTLQHAFHNGILLDEESIVVNAKDILDLNLLSQSGSFQIPKSIHKKSSNEQSQQEFKAAPIANNGTKTNFNPTDRNRTSKSWSDEINSNNEQLFESTTTNGNTFKNSQQIQEKYRCDQMILEHNNGPIDYEQIVLPIPTSKKYLTDEGLVIPAINLELRQKLFHSAEYYGYSKERTIESMARCTSDMCLHLLGGTQRLLVKNRRQHPTIVVLACRTEIQGAYAICAARILASKNIQVYLYLPPINQNNSIQPNFIENELKLFQTTQAILTTNVSDLPNAPIDLILNGLDAANNSDSVLFAKPWYRQVVQYCSRLQATVIGVDPPLDGGAIECKYSLVPLLPLLTMSTKNVGRLYLCDLAFGQQVFQHLQIRYSSPFGAKSFVALHDN